ncbi:hypothetical protein Tco_1086846 [Tanacetum coccineum]
MHNNIMAAGSKIVTMLATGRYAQWRSRFLRYIDTRPNGAALRKCILEGPYTPTTFVVPAVLATENSLAVLEQTTVEIVLNMSPANKAHFKSEKEAIHLILTGIGDKIYSTVNACQTAQEMWEAIKRLTETIESYYIRFYKMMNEMIRNNLTVATMKVSVQFLQQLQPEWKLFELLMMKDWLKNLYPLALVAIAQTLQDPYYQSSNVSNHLHNIKRFTSNQNAKSQKGLKTLRIIRKKMLMCKQAEKGVPLQAEQSDWLADMDDEIDEQELKAHYSFMEKIQEVLIADLGTDTEPLEQVDSNVIPDPSDMCDNDIQTDQNVVECDDERVALANLIANLKLDVDENKKIQKQLKKANTSLAHELTECKSIFAETSRTLGESNSIRDSCLVALQNKQTEFERYKTLNDHTVDYKKLEHNLNETLGLLAQKGIDIKEGLKLKAYEILVVKEKHDELVKQILLTKSHYEGLVKEKTKDHFRAPTAHDMEILIKTCLMLLALKTQNDSFAFVHELKQEMHADLMYVESLEKEIDELESDKAEFSNMYDILLQECVSNDVMCSYLHLLSDLDVHTKLQCLYLHKVKECECLAQKLLKQTETVSKEFYTELLRSFAKLEKRSISLELALQKYQEQMKNNIVCKEKASNVFQKEHEQYFEIQDLKAQLQDKNIAICELKKLIEKCKGKSMETKFDKPSVVRQPNAQRILKPSVLGKPTPFSNSLERKKNSKTKSVSKTNASEGLSKQVTIQILPQTARQAVRNTNMIKPGMYRIDTRTTQTRAPQLPQTYRNTNPRVSTSTGVTHNTNVSRPQLKSTQMKDKVMPNTSQVKFKKTEVEYHHRISSISKKTKSVTTCNDSLKSITSNVNVVCATCKRCVFDSDHYACVSKFLNDVNARTKKPEVVPISTRKPKRKANKSVATSPKKIVASESTVQNSQELL